jgi:hypothetical protein
VLLCVFATVAHAQSVLPEHLHAPVEVDPGMGWNELIAATVAAHPRQFELAALDSTAAAWQARGRQWFSATPYGTFSYLSDHIGNDRNQAEYYSGLNLPLWRIGQRDTAQELGRSSVVQSTAS